jgi:DNA-dependent RNA polymerase
MLLTEVLTEDSDLISQWQDFFGLRDQGTFEKRLLKQLLDGKLNMIVGQLLLLRKGAYDRIGVFYDASASAYQIMGTINGDAELCRLTNVLRVDDKKKDIYKFFLEVIRKHMHLFKVKTSSKDAEFSKSYNAHLSKNFDRALVKAIVMPLIYGKTSQGFAEDLQTFFVAVA